MKANIMNAISFKSGGAVPRPPIPRSEEEIVRGWKGDLNTPLVSVVCITFNHERYISEALDSFLAQITTFPFEVVVHDDCSTDSTRAIIESYVDRYPRMIKPVFQSVNQFSQGKRPTFLAAKFTKGRYIALCEGDDFWTSTDKLQIQSEFLENNCDYAAVTHQTIKFFEDSQFVPQPFVRVQKDHWELDDLLFDRKYHTASLMARGDIFRNNELPDNIVSGDKAISFLLLSYGKIKYLPEVMAVYRKNPGGISSWVTSDIMAGDFNLLPWLKKIDPEFPIIKYRAIIHGTVLCYPKKIRIDVAVKNYILFCFWSFSYFPRNLRSIISLGKSLSNRALRRGFIGFKGTK